MFPEDGFQARQSKSPGRWRIGKRVGLGRESWSAVGNRSGFQGQSWLVSLDGGRVAPRPVAMD